MIDNNKLAALVQAALATGRSYRALWEMLNEDELEVIVCNFLDQEAPHYCTVKIEGWQTLDDRKIEAIKAIRSMAVDDEIPGWATIPLKMAKDFTEGQKITIYKKTASKINAYLKAQFPNATLIYC